MNRISLDTRLERLGQNRPSDPEFTARLLEAAVDLTVRDLLVKDDVIEDLATALGVGNSEAASMTYGEVAVRVHDMWLAGGLRRERAIDAMYRLIAPYFREKERRKRCAKEKP